MDRVYIRGLKVETVIGVYSWERIARQTLIFDLEMAHDLAPAALENDLNKTLNYKAISQTVLNFVRASDYELIETLAEEVAALVMREFGVCWIRVGLLKPGAVEEAQSVGIQIERGSLHA